MGSGYDWELREILTSEIPTGGRSGCDSTLGISRQDTGLLGGRASIFLVKLGRRTDFDPPDPFQNILTKVAKFGSRLRHGRLEMISSDRDGNDQKVETYIEG